MIDGGVLMTNTTVMNQSMDIFQVENQKRIIKSMINQLFEQKHNHEWKERKTRQSISLSDWQQK